MPYRVEAGSLTVIALTPSEALKIRDRLLSDDTPHVDIADMDGKPLSIDWLNAVTSDE